MDRVSVRREYVHLPVGPHARLPLPARVAHLSRRVALAPLYWAAAHRLGTPGLAFQRRCASLATRLLQRRASVPRATILQLLTAPMDSVRYFEFDFAWEALTRRPAGPRYLDVSSPRLLPLLLVAEHPAMRAELINPDRSDLEATRVLTAACGLEERISLRSCVVTEAPFAPASFDLITSISVVEHIPDDVAALRAIWALLRPGGRLVLSVPCAAEHYEEYVDFNEYRLLEADERGFVFAQRFYDEPLLAERVFGVTGRPVSARVFGEREPGAFARNREWKLSDPLYPSYREPFMVGREYRFFDRVADLPGIGVIAMEFVKP